VTQRLGAEFIGTFWLVLGGCGSAVLAATFPETGIGFVGVAFAFGLTVLTMAYAIGHISGCHLNPAVTLGLKLGGRFDSWKDVAVYMLVQILGAVFAILVLFIVLKGTVRITASRPQGEVELARLGPGEILGEMSHFDDEPRSATAQALGPLDLLVFDRENFGLIFQLHPKWTMKIVVGLSLRIVRTLEQVDGKPL